ncbi:unnamed protein product [Prunus armeniaca]
MDNRDSGNNSATSLTNVLHQGNQPNKSQLESVQKNKGHYLPPYRKAYLHSHAGVSNSGDVSKTSADMQGSTTRADGEG